MLVAVPQSPNKVVRHRERLRAAGLRPVQFWVRDTRSPEYARRIRQQCLALNDAPEETQVMDFVHAAANLVDGWE